MKKILIFYGTYGGGHVAAAKSIKDFINNNYIDADVTFIDCMEYISKSVNKISTKAYVGMTKKTPKLWKKLYSSTDKKSTIRSLSDISNKVMAIKLKKLIFENKPDLIVSTHPFSSYMCAYLKKKKQIDCPIATIMTDYHIHGQWLELPEYIDYYFVADDQMKKDMVNLGIEASKIHVTGIPYSPRFLEKYDKQEVCDDFWLDKDKFTMLLFGGGEFGLGQKVASKFLEAGIRMFKDMQVVAISGKNAKMKKEFEKIVEKTSSESRVKVIEFTDKIPELMAISDMVVTKPGGLTVTESLVSGLPIIIINPIPGQEEENAKFLVNEGCAIWVKTEKDIFDTLKYIYKHPEKLEEMRKASTHLAKKNSTKDICDILLKDM